MAELAVYTLEVLQGFEGKEHLTPRRSHGII